MLTLLGSPTAVESPSVVTGCKITEDEDVVSEAFPLIVSEPESEQPMKVKRPKIGPKIDKFFIKIPFS